MSNHSPVRLVAFGVALVVATLVIGAIIWVAFDVEEVWNRYWLERHGVRTEATVMHVWTDEDDPSSTTHAKVSILACSCDATVHVGSDHHAAWSALAVWYDPNEPTHAVAAEDIARDGYAWLALCALFLACFFVPMVRGGRMANAWKNEAVSLGFTYKWSPEPFDIESAPLSLGRRKRSYRNALVGIWRGLEVDCRECRATTGGGEAQQTTSRFAVTTTLDPTPPPLWIGSAKQSKILNKALKKAHDESAFGGEVLLPEAALPPGTLLRCPNAPFAGAVVGGGAGDVLKETPKSIVELHGGRLFFFPAVVTPALLEDALLQMSRIERAIRSASAMTVPAAGNAPE